MALLYIDLGSFQAGEPEAPHGHAVGDLLLREAAQHVRDCVRESDTVGRFGATGSLVLLPRVRVPDDALRVAEKIRSTLAAPSWCPASASSSISVTLCPDDGRGESTVAGSRPCDV